MYMWVYSGEKKVCNDDDEKSEHERNYILDRYYLFCIIVYLITILLSCYISTLRYLFFTQLFVFHCLFSDNVMVFKNQIFKLCHRRMHIIIVPTKEISL